MFLGLLTLIVMDASGLRCRVAPELPDPHSDRHAVFPRICRRLRCTRRGALLVAGVTS